MENLNIKLIEGTFSPREARKVLSTVISSKINYHKIDVMSEYERFTPEDNNSRKRVEYLQNAKEEVLDLIHKAIEENKNFEIIGTISIIIK